ncbi:transcriptional repressor CTCFL isoform X1 [Neodiprion lecontei]|uniref:Transcriptional repressor CTCFL isoform X1 n=2 Tax=Neodiprion lecontei TaxID=441921 RepID=A0A6J0B6Z3_NEOLC|nr:transcriptional repressor CTCFL isoform X1 [Neodiprion lecontei]
MSAYTTTKMALEEEAQICRLCGQCESIYIDVFGEEGTKRYLGLKIHTKINILIKEDDGLTQKVCMRCIGTLEFVSDFHTKCHETQQQLLQAKERTKKLTERDVKVDSEVDKENILPNNSLIRSNGAELKVLPTTEDVKFEGNRPFEQIFEYHNKQSLPRKSSRIQKKKLNKVKILKEENKVFERVTGSLENIGNLRENGVMEISECQNQRTLPNKTRKAALARSRNSKTIKTHGKSCNGLGQGGATLTHSDKRKIGRKNCGNRKMQKNESKNLACSTSWKNNLMERGVRGTGRAVQGIIKFDGKCSKHNSRNENNSKKFDEQLTTFTEDKINESNNVPNMLKGENSNWTMNRSEKFVKLRACAIMSITQCSSRGVGAESVEKSPQPGEEAGEIQSWKYDTTKEWAGDDISKIESVQDVGRETNSTAALLVRNSVIKLVKDVQTNRGDEFASTLLTVVGSSNDEINCQRNESKIIDAPLSLIDSLKDDGSQELNKHSKRNVTSCQDRRKKSEGRFGKLTELITNEQKEIIETLYTVNMGVVNDEKVHKNIKILDKVRVTCSICGKIYSRMDKCQVHVWGHLNMKPYCCKSCDFVTLTVSNIRCHIRKRHLKIKPFHCNLCEKSYGTAVLLEEHINSHTGAKPYKCKICDFATSNRQVLSYHKTTHKPAKDISCEVCGKKFFSNCRMRAHMIVHKKDRSLICKLCSTYLCNAEALKKHYDKVHSRDYICSVCGIRTKSKKALTNHEKVHSAAKYRCPLCSNVYKSKHMLKEHILKHQGIRKYKCELCQKSFGQQSHISAHMSVHMGKRYPCPGCSKLFNRKDNMRIHTRRCKVFNSNPEMKNLWMDQMDATSSCVTNTKSVSVSEAPAIPAATTQASTYSKSDEKIETNLGMTKINLPDTTDDSTSFKSTSDLRDSRDFIRDQGIGEFKSDKDGKVLRLGEVEVFPLPNTNIIAFQNEGNMVITENVLRPECF